MEIKGRSRWLAVLVGAALCLETAGTVQASRPVLRVGIHDAGPDIGVADGAGAYHSINTDYMQILASYAGMDVVFVRGTARECEERLVRGEVDVLPGLVRTEARSRTMAFSRLPMGRGYTTLYLRGGQEALYSGEGSLLLGTLPGRYQSAQLPEVMREAGRPFETEGFRDYHALMAACEAGTIDGYFIANQGLGQMGAAAAVFDVNPLYFAVRADNTALLARLDRAADELAIVHPQLIDDLDGLYERWAGDSRPLLLDAEERQFLAEHKTLRVVCVARERPYAYIREDGKLHGALKRIAERLEQDLGVAVEVEPLTEAEAAYARVASGEADICLNMAWDPGWAAQLGMDQTVPFMESYYTLVLRRGSAMPAAPRVACLDSRFADEVLQQAFGEDHLVRESSVAACLAAVRTGRADAACIRQEAAQYQTMRGDFPDLVSTGAVAYRKRIAMGVSKQADPVLLHLLDKEIRCMGPDVPDAYFAQQTRRAIEERSVFSYLCNYPFQILGGVLVLFLLGVLWFLRDRRQRRSHVQRLQETLDHDRYTGLHNVTWFERAGNKVIRAGKDETAQLAVVVIKAAQPEVIAATYGREAIVKLLRRLGEQLLEMPWAKLAATRTNAASAVCLTQPMERDDLRGAIFQLMRESEYLEVGHMLVRAPLVAGVCYLGAPPMDLGTALNNATLAAESAEPIGFFNSALQRDTLLQSRMESLQQGALERGEFHIWYQPKYDLVTRKCVGAEALVRWQSAELGFLPPGKFISLFESNGFITQLDFYNLEHVMEFQRDCKEKGLPVVPISVNQSRLHMREKGYLRRMNALVERYTTEGIELELTETAFDFGSEAIHEHSLAVVTALHAMGFVIDMDDFGTGYSDLSLLNQLPLDVMKIDRSLLLASEGSERMRIVLKMMIDLGHALGMRVICEGIETEEQEALLRAVGCKYGQGFLYGRPMQRADFEAFLRAHA